MAKRGEARTDPEVWGRRIRPHTDPDQPAPAGGYEPTEPWPDPPVPAHRFDGDPQGLYRWVCACGHVVEEPYESMARNVAHEHAEGPLW